MLTHRPTRTAVTFLLTAMAFTPLMARAAPSSPLPTPREHDDYHPAHRSADFDARIGNRALQASGWWLRVGGRDDPHEVRLLRADRSSWWAFNRVALVFEIDGKAFESEWDDVSLLGVAVSALYPCAVAMLPCSLASTAWLVAAVLASTVTADDLMPAGEGALGALGFAVMLAFYPLVFVHGLVRRTRAASAERATGYHALELLHSAHEHFPRRPPRRRRHAVGPHAKVMAY